VKVTGSLANNSPKGVSLKGKKKETKKWVFET
jgi:hypothetical protein